MRTVLGYAKPYIGRMSWGLAIKLTGTLMDLVLPWVLSYMIDTVVPSGKVTAVYLYGALMVFCAFIAVLFNVVANRMAAKASMRVVEALRHDLFKHISALSFASMDALGVPSLISRLTNDTYNVHQMFDKMQRLGVRAPLLVVGGIVMTFLLEPALAWILLLIVPLLVVVVRFASRRGIPLYRTAQQTVEGLVRTVRENAAGVRVIKALSKGDYERDRFERVNAAAAAAETRAGTVMSVANPAMSFLLNFGLMLVLLVGAQRVDRGLMQPGKIIAFLSYFTIILNATLSVTKMFVLYSRGSASAQRVEEILLTPEGQPLLPPDVVPCADTAYLSFENVSFSYNGKRDNLKHVSFTLRRGGTLGLFGPTGCGKTTLLSLLLRFYDADTGTIRIAGENVQSIPPARLRALFGAVFQNDVLLMDSVYENISFMRSLPLEQVRRAAETAQAASFIERLPGAYFAPLNIHGANLSGGQRQRLLLARALAGAPELLVLDDAESALDYRTDANLRQAIRAQYPEATLLIVSERVSSIKNADCILVLDDGAIIGRGTHEALMESCEPYRRIARVQMGGAA